MVHSAFVALTVAAVLGYGGLDGGGRTRTTYSASGATIDVRLQSGAQPTSAAKCLPKGTATEAPDVAVIPSAVPPPVPAADRAVIIANPANYLSLIKHLMPGQTLVLEPGDYEKEGDVPGLPLFNINGTPSDPIIITGPESGPRPRFLGRSSHNTVRLIGSSHLIIRNLEVDGRGMGAAGIAAQGANHDITIENIYIHGVGNDQQTVGISASSAPNWNWIIRGNSIVAAGTGIYLGNSDGENAFVNGLIENNLIRDTIGYNLQIKHQNPRSTLPGMPSAKSVTVIRNNVFSKSDNSSTGSAARPNVLIGSLPSTGPGSEDHYEIYGNLFWQNPAEALFQGEGNIAFYSNVLATSTGAGINIQPHHGVPKTVRIFGNTVVAKTSGVVVSNGHPDYIQRVESNAVFSDEPISAVAQSDNLVGGYDDTGLYLNNSTNRLELFEPFPREGAPGKAHAKPPGVDHYGNWDRDFNGDMRDWSIPGAYSSRGSNPGRKPWFRLIK